MHSDTVETTLILKTVIPAEAGIQFCVRTTDARANSGGTYLA